MEPTPTVHDLPDRLRDGRFEEAAVERDPAETSAPRGELHGLRVERVLQLLGEERETWIRRMASRDRVEDVLVTLGHQHHVLRPLRHRDGFCLFVVFDRRMTKLAWARHRVAEIESRLRF